MNWQPIETAPKDGSVFVGMRVLGVCHQGDESWREYFVHLAAWEQGFGFGFLGKLLAGHPTHWTPFKEPPA